MEKELFFQYYDLAMRIANWFQSLGFYDIVPSPNGMSM
jgi:hypothetical protein